MQDGVINKDELLRTTQDYAEEIEFTIPSDDTMAFSLKLFDLNQDGAWRGTRGCLMPCMRACVHASSGPELLLAGWWQIAPFTTCLHECMAACMLTSTATGGHASMRVCPGSSTAAATATAVNAARRTNACMHA